jgi:hypothetical protein
VLAVLLLLLSLEASHPCSQQAQEQAGRGTSFVTCTSIRMCGAGLQDEAIAAPNTQAPRQEHALLTQNGLFGITRATYKTQDVAAAAVMSPCHGVKDQHPSQARAAIQGPPRSLGQAYNAHGIPQKPPEPPRASFLPTPP